MYTFRRPTFTMRTFMKTVKSDQAMFDKYIARVWDAIQCIRTRFLFTSISIIFGNISEFISLSCSLAYSDRLSDDLYWNWFGLWSRLCHTICTLVASLSHGLLEHGSWDLVWVGRFWSRKYTRTVGKKSKRKVMKETCFV